jgi:hypothetical protein
VAAGEDQLEPFVRECRRLHRVLLCLGQVLREQAGLLGQGAIAANAVDRPVARRADQPAVGIGREPVARPALGGDCEGLLRGFLGEVDVAEEADQGSEDASPLIAEGLVEDR